MEGNDKLLSRLDGIFILLYSILSETDHTPRLSTIFYQLKNVGLTNEEISNLTGKTSTQVAKIAYEHKRSKTRS